MINEKNIKQAQSQQPQVVSIKVTHTECFTNPAH